MSCDLEGILIHTRITQTVTSLIHIRHRYFFLLFFSPLYMLLMNFPDILHMANEILCMSALPSLLKNTSHLPNKSKIQPDLMRMRINGTPQDNSYVISHILSFSSFI